jgi:Zn-dependent protease with chaperone function
MIEFSGFYFDGKTSKDHAVHCVFDGRRLRVRGEEVSLEPLIEECRINPPLANSRRKIYLPGGGLVETANLIAVEELEAQIGRNTGLTWVNRIEGQWRWVLAAVIVLGIFSFAFVRYSLPYMARVAAFATPSNTLKPLSEEAIKLFDDQFLKPTKLSLARQAELQTMFAAITRDIGGSSYRYRLELRQGDKIGANAFALPSGIIVFTDELLKLAQNHREVAGVMAHEVGHVIRRHSLRGLYQGAGVLLLVSLYVGDFASVTSLAASLPVVLMQSGYSRGFEREADRVAGEYMLRKGWGTKPLQEMLTRLEGSRGGGSNSANKDPLSVLSTHPGTEERVENLKRQEEGK